MEGEAKKVTKTEAKSDALKLVKAAKAICENHKWKTRQDQREVNKVYTCICAAEAALEMAAKEESVEEEK